MSTRFKFLTILFTIITLSALMSHLFELRTKVTLSKEHYQTLQSINRGWAWLGVFEIVPTLLTALWAFKERENKNAFPYLMISLICFVVSIIIFFLFIFPVNQVTYNWTQTPQGWQILMQKWKYSQAINAALYLTGFGFLIGVLFSQNPDK